MARAYSDDLRRKLLEAHRLGEGSLEQLAGRFRVSVSWAKRVSAALRRTGKVERPPAGPRGRRSKLTPEVQQQLRAWIARQPDLTLAELQHKLLEQRRLYSSLSRLWEVLRVMGLRLKKSHSTPPSRTPKQVGCGAISGVSKPVRSPRKG
jgi:transposase